MYTGIKYSCIFTSSNGTGSIGKTCKKMKIKTAVFDKTNRLVTFESGNIAYCSNHEEWDTFDDGEVLADGIDFEVQECNFSYVADITSSDFRALPFRKYYNDYPDQKEKKLALIASY